MRRSAISLALATSLALTSHTAFAGNDALLGAVMGGIIGGAIAAQPKRAPSSSSRNRSSGSSVSSATRQQNRDIQTSLNYFGFNAGTADGVLGSKSRRAASEFQTFMAFAPTGTLSPYERDFLIASYHRAQSGGVTTAQLISSNPNGVRGLLKVYLDEQLNGPGGSSAIAGSYGLPAVVAAAVNEIAKSSDPSAEQLVQRSGFIQLADMNGDGQTDYILDTSVTGSAFWCNAESCAVRVFASTPNGYERNDFQAFNVTPAMFQCQRGVCAKSGATVPQMALGPVTPTAPIGNGTTLAAAPQGVATPVPTAQPVVSGGAAKAAAGPAMPDFFSGQQAAGVSLASHCNKVSLLTSTNGGFVTADTLTDANYALSEQMCLARTYAIAAGEELIAKVQGATPEQVATQCEAFTPLLKEYVAAVSIQPREEVLRAVSGFVLNSGMPAPQLASTARVCLSVGYRTDNMDLAMGSALLLSALGERPYDELMGHHLSQGIGAAKRKDLALAWYGSATDSVRQGAKAVFAPGQSERVDLLVKAVAMIAPAQDTGNAATTAAPAGTIPVLAISE